MRLEGLATNWTNWKKRLGGVWTAIGAKGALGIGEGSVESGGRAGKVFVRLRESGKTPRVLDSWRGFGVVKHSVEGDVIACLDGAVYEHLVCSFALIGFKVRPLHHLVPVEIVLYRNVSASQCPGVKPEGGPG